MQYVTHGDSETKTGLALHLIFSNLRKLHKVLKVDHFVFALDSKSWRYDIYPQYKASRRVARLKKTSKELEEDALFYETFNDFSSFLIDKTKCTVLKEDKIEADDFVARWIQLHPEDEHIIVSGDSDFIQLLDSNVKIYDGINERLISTTEILDKNNQSLEFSIDGSSGKLKIGKPSINNIIENEWWKKALFIKCIRGDIGDGIFSAFPGVRYKGTSKKTGINEAWEDRNSMGYNYNNLMLQKWSKLLDVDKNGNKIIKEVYVKDEYEFNRRLIDLTYQPDNIKNIMDKVIINTIQKEKKINIGWDFIKFCQKHELNNLLKEAHDHAKYLNAGYNAF